MQWQLEGDRPIYQQLVDQIMMQIVSGQRKAGDKVPAVRELAAEAGVNPNTMQRALADLERQGLLYTNRTSGRYVTEDEEMITKIRERIAEERICAFLESMSDDTAAVPVDHCSQIQKTVFDRDICNVNGPCLIWLIDDSVAE